MEDSDEEQALRRDLEQALAQVRTMRQEQPQDAIDAFAGVMRLLIDARNRLIARRRADAGAGAGADAGMALSLPALNALTSVAVSMEYPLAGIHWKRLESLRSGLEDLLKR
jgi:hypothetical protein